MTAQAHPTTILATIGLVSALSTGIAKAQCEPATTASQKGTLIGLSAGDGVSPELIETAIHYWQRCPDYGQDFPAFDSNGQGQRTIEVLYFEGSSNREVCGRFTATRIELYEEAIGPDGRTIACGSLGQNLAHELGHVLGLKDHSDRFRCPSQIMGPVTTSRAHSRRVHDDECETAGRLWLTAAEEDRAVELGLIDDAGYHPPLAVLLEQLQSDTRE